MRLGNISITAKILGVIGIMAALALGTNLFAVSSMSTVSREYSLLIHHEANTANAAARANRNLSDVGRLMYKLIAERNDAETKRLLGRIEQEGEAFRKEIAQAKDDPEKVRAVDHLIAGYDAIAPALAEAGRAALAQNDAEALQMMTDKVEPAMLKLRGELMAFADQALKELRAADAETTALADRAHVLTLAIAIMGIVICLGIAVAVARIGISQPIRRVVGVLERLVTGDAAVQVEGAERKDEVGGIALAAEAFRQSLLRTRDMERQAKEAEERAQADRRRAMLDLAASFEARVGGVIGSVGSAATELQATACQLAATVQQLNGQCTTVAAAAEQASASVQTVASASEEMSASITDLSGRVTQAAGTSKAAARSAEDAQRQMDTLRDSIEQVGQIVAAINAVASQTNLLALNATIEAARAGEAGKGFAVVASEVKNLATQTHSMLDQISAQIAAVRNASEGAMAAMRGIVGQVLEIDHSAGDMAAAVEQQSAATGEISRNAQQASVGTTAVSRSIVGIQQAGSDTDAASDCVRRAADDLAKQSATLQREMGAFLGDIRRA